MTTPVERTRAVIYAHALLYDLITPSKTPRVPRAIRDRALRALRHFPFASDLNRSAARMPELWGPVE